VAWLEASHLDLKPRRQWREEEKVKTAQGWPIEAIVEVAPPPVCVDLAPCATASSYQERLLGAGETLVAMHMSRNHSHGFTGLHKEWYKGALDCEIVRHQDTIGIRGMVQQDEDTADVGPLFKALKLLFIPADLFTPLGHW
jgi:hypothetical protein